MVSWRALGGAIRVTKGLARRRRLRRQRAAVRSSWRRFQHRGWPLRVQPFRASDGLETSFIQRLTRGDTCAIDGWVSSARAAKHGSRAPRVRSDGREILIPTALEPNQVDGVVPGGKPHSALTRYLVESPNCFERFSSRFTEASVQSFSSHFPDVPPQSYYIQPPNFTLL